MQIERVGDRNLDGFLAGVVIDIVVHAPHSLPPTANCQPPTLICDTLDSI
jgi:hypothetical protein